jgi:predicted acylesterase/phospholipase RssA
MIQSRNYNTVQMAEQIGLNLACFVVAGLFYRSIVNTYAHLPSWEITMADYDFNLVFEGGGAKGLVFVGAIQEFEAQGYTVGRLLGTSAGAITATLLAAGFNAAELLAGTNEKLPNGKSRFSTFMDVPDNFSPQDIESSLTNLIFQAIDLPFISESAEQKIDKTLINAMMRVSVYRQLFSLIEKGGLYAGDAFVEWFSEKLNQSGRNLGDTTLAEFNEITSKDLTVVASDTTAGKILALNHRTAPNCPVVSAVRMSMSIPFVWQEVRWQSEWGTYRGKNIDNHIIVDGGVLSNFPIDLLISTDPETVEMMGEPDQAFTIGLLIDESLPVHGLSGLSPADPDPAAGQLQFKSITAIRRVVQLVDTMLRGHDKLVIDAYADGVCRLPAQGFEATDFDLSMDRTTALIDAGRTEMRKFLHNLRHFLQTNNPNKLPKK